MNTSVENNNIKFFVPCDIEKGKNDKGDVVMKFRGRASTGSKDSQGETLDPKGFDLNDFRTINWNHGKTPDMVIGEPTKHILKGDNLDIEGELYSEMPQAVATYNLMKALKKRGKGLALSVEGKVIERGHTDPKNPLYNKIKKAKITACAITANPINGNTFAELIEKGYTNNEWEYDKEDVEDIEKAFTVEGNQDLVKEDVEGKKNKKKAVNKINDIADDSNKNKESLPKKISKADTYEKIFSYFYGIDIKKAQSIYKLIEKIATMSKTDKEITDETISKAFEMLESDDTTIIKSEDQIALEAKEKEDYNEMVEKAKTVVKGLVDQDLEKSVVVEKMIEKGYGEKIINEAYDLISGNTVVKSESNTEIMKSLDGFNSNINKKFGAIADLFKSQSEQMDSIKEELASTKEDLQKSFDTVTSLNDTISNFARTPGQRRAVTNFADKNFKGEGIEKSEDGKKSFNVKDHDSRKALIGLLNEESGINKGGDYDKELIQIAQDLELVKSVDTRALGRLNAMDIDIIQ